MWITSQCQAKNMDKFAEIFFDVKLNKQQKEFLEMLKDHQDRKIIIFTSRFGRINHLMREYRRRARQIVFPNALVKSEDVKKNKKTL